MVSNADPFWVIPVKPIPIVVREELLTLVKSDVLIRGYIIAVTFTPGDVPRLTILDAATKGMYHDLDYSVLGTKVCDHLTFLCIRTVFCPPDPPVVTNYLEQVANKEVCLFSDTKNFICHGTYYLSFEWATEVWHLILTDGFNFVVFRPTHKVIWCSTHRTGKCSNDHHLLPNWTKQRSLYNR